MDIIITKDSFRTLENVITDLTCLDLVQRFSTTIARATIVAVQDKAQSYTKQTPKDDFIPLVIKTYNCPFSF